MEELFIAADLTNVCELRKLQVFSPQSAQSGTLLENRELPVTASKLYMAEIAHSDSQLPLEIIFCIVCLGSDTDQGGGAHLHSSRCE